MVIGMIAMISYGLADTYFVGQLGTLPLAAMSFTFPVAFVMSGISFGIGTGTSSVLARLMGSGDRRAVQRLTTHSIMLGALLGLVMLTLGLLTIDPLFTALGATEETLPLIHEYMQILYLGGMFSVLPMIGNSAIRATGDAKMPAIIMSVSALFNITLDPIMIFGLFGMPRMELRGAAIATVLASMGTFVAAFAILYFREGLIRFRYVALKGLLDSWRTILHVGIPAMANNLVVPVTVGVITSLVAAYGPEAVAGFGVASRIEAMSLIVVFAISAAIAPFVGQNAGAGALDRVQRAVRLSIVFCQVYGLLMAGVLALFAPTIVAAFDDHPGVLQAATQYLWVVPVTFGAFGVSMVTSTAFNALGKPLPSTVLMFVKMIVVYIPLATLGSRYIGLLGIFGAYAIAHLVMGTAAFFWLRSTLKTLQQRTVYARQQAAA
jgi:putative MATE family efflux protein